MITKLVLGSQSPRRAELLKALGLNFRQISSDSDESYPSTLKGAAICDFIARAKAESLKDQIEADELLICSDTIVCWEEQVLGKPTDFSEAKQMLQKLSGHSHLVISSICLSDKEKSICLHDSTEVFFRKLEDTEIDYYLKNYKPYDKAGAYGIQEWIGMIGIEKIIGSYFTVMGLPTHLILPQLKAWRTMPIG
jgi:septum formation protein